MKNKGFTIVEMLLTIVIIGVITTAASVGINQIMVYKERKAWESFVNELESGACLLVDLSKYNDEIITIDNKSLVECRGNNQCIIRTDYLLQEGIITDRLVNPRTKKTIDEYGYVIKVNWNDGLKTCRLEYE